MPPLVHFSKNMYKSGSGICSSNNLAILGIASQLRAGALK